MTHKIFHIITDIIIQFNFEIVNYFSFIYEICIVLLYHNLKGGADMITETDRYFIERKYHDQKKV